MEEQRRSECSGVMTVLRLGQCDAQAAAEHRNQSTPPTTTQHTIQPTQSTM